MKKIFLAVLVLLYVFTCNAQILTVSTTTVNTGAAPASSSTITITSDTYWGVYNVPEWVYLSNEWGQGNSVMTISVAENPFSVERTSSFILYWCDANKNPVSQIEIVVTQQASLFGIADTLLTVAAPEGSSANFSIISNTYWEIVNIPSWLSVNKNYQVGSATVTVTATENPLTTTRTGTFQLRRVSYYNKAFVTATIYITQSASVSGISEYEIYLDATEGSTGSFSITSNVSWNISGNDNWLQVNPLSASGTANVSVRASENSNVYYRSDTLNITFSNGKKSYVVIIQKPSDPFWFVSPSVIQIAADGSPLSLSVSSNTNWEIFDYPDWIVFSDAYGYGSLSTNISAGINPYTKKRNATFQSYWLDFYGVFYEDTTIAVSQSASVYGVSDSVLQVQNTQNSNASFSITIPANSYWEVTDLPVWLTLDKNYLTTSETVLVTATLNPLTTVRTGSFTVDFWVGNDLVSALVVVNQLPSPLGISDEYFEIGAEGEEVVLTITANTSWSVSGQDSWVGVSPTSSTGNGVVRLNVLENTSIYYRVDTLLVTFSGGKKTQVVVFQEPAKAVFETVPVKLVFDWPANSSVSVSVNSNTEWGVMNFPSWITSSPVYGFGDKNFVLYASENTTTASKIDSLLTYWFDELKGYHQKWITVVQKAKPITQTINLQAGWNLISLNVQPADSSITSIFSQIITKIDIIKCNDSYYRSGNATVLNSLRYFEMGKGYLVKMKQAATLTVTGVPSIMTIRELRSTLHSGWNLVGAPFSSPLSITQVFDISQIEEIKNLDGFYIPNDPQSSLNLISPTEAYFVNIK